VSLGTYVTVEQVGDQLLSRYYEDGDADLYKPEPPSGYLTYRRDDFNAYTTANYEANNEADHRTFLKLLQTIEQSDVSEWDEVIDVSMGHNYYLFEATPGRMVMLPWDMNLSQAATSAACPMDVRAQGAAPGGTGMLPEGIPSGAFLGGGGFAAPPGGVDGGAFVPPDGVPIGGGDGGAFFGGGKCH
jgi:spore coat protein CotH